jgi:hypothetical protein
MHMNQYPCVGVLDRSVVGVQLITLNGRADECYLIKAEKPIRCSFNLQVLSDVAKSMTIKEICSSHMNRKRQRAKIRSPVKNWTKEWCEFFHMLKLMEFDKDMKHLLFQELDGPLMHLLT